MVNPAEQVASSNVLPDGRYDVLVLDAEVGDDTPAITPHTEGDASLEAGTSPDVEVRLEVVVTAGEFKGEVVALRTSGQSLLPGGIDPSELLALPGWLTVTGGQPSFLLA